MQYILLLFILFIIMLFLYTPINMIREYYTIKNKNNYIKKLR